MSKITEVADVVEVNDKCEIAERNDLREVADVRETQKVDKENEKAQPGLKRKSSRLSRFFLRQPDTAEIDTAETDAKAESKPVACPLKELTNIESRKSITGLKIRDNMSYYLGLSKNEEQPASDAPRIEKPQIGETSNSETSASETPSKNEEFLGIPSSRLAFFEDSQRMAFKVSLRTFREREITYNFYFKWVLWVENLNPKRDLRIFQMVETNYDLEDAFRFFKANQTTYNKFHFFRLGVMPRRKSTKLKHGTRIEFKVPSVLASDFVSESLKMVLGDILYLPSNIQSMYEKHPSLQRSVLTSTVPILGVTFKNCNSEYSVLIFWTTQPIQQDPTCFVELLDLVRDTIPSYLHKILHLAVLVANSTLESYNIFKESP